jgi:hypothetical protein
MRGEPGDKVLGQHRRQFMAGQAGVVGIKHGKSGNCGLIPGEKSWGLFFNYKSSPPRAGLPDGVFSNQKSKFG